MTDTTFDRSVLGFEAAKLLEVLLSVLGEDGRGQVSTTTLLKESGLTQGALTRARGELTRHHLLRTEVGFSASGLRGANIYVLNLPALEPTSMPRVGGESGQNRTEGSGSEAPPVVPLVRSPLGTEPSSRKGFWSRMLRRQQAS